MHTQELRRSAAPPARKRARSEPVITTTPDRRYMIVKDRLWRLSNPDLQPEDHAYWVGELMTARRALKGAQSVVERVAARIKVDTAKRALGERGVAWWTDGAPDYNRQLVGETPYRTWYEKLKGTPSR